MRPSKVIWTSGIMVPKGMESIRNDVFKLSSVLLHVVNERAGQLHANSRSNRFHVGQKKVLADGFPSVLICLPTKAVSSSHPIAVQGQSFETWYDGFVVHVLMQLKIEVLLER